MKIDWNTKYTTISVYAFILSCSVILFYLSISEIGILIENIIGVIGILQPFIVGFSISYILNFILKYYEKNMRKLQWLQNVISRVREVLD